jgi:hypothetical protein
MKNIYLYVSIYNQIYLINIPYDHIPLITFPLYL